MAAILLAFLAARAAGNPAARFHALSPADCSGPGNFVSQSDPAPLGVTYMRVQHIGDAGTFEQAQQVAHGVSWDVSQVTGLATPASAQRGYRDQGPGASSAFQLWCDGAGFYLDSFTFRHAAPLTGEGPSASIARDYDPPLPLFDGDTAALVMQATVRVPHVRVQSQPVIVEGTAQVSFFHYVRDRTTGTTLAQLVQLFENRAPGTRGAGVESLDSDGVVAFASSPLDAMGADGRPVRYATAAGTERMRYAPWSEPREFRVRITRANFEAMLADLRAERLPHISPRADDYGLVLFGMLAEIFPFTGDANNVAMGGSVHGMTLMREPLLRVPHARMD
jgi:hypothetical protein